VAAAFERAGWSVRAGTRDVKEAARRLPRYDWLKADFADLRSGEAWAPLLGGIDAVVNCVGVLQDAAGDSSRIAHVSGPAALVEACERVGVRRFVHVSAVGAESDAGTSYARDKAATEAMLRASGLDWVVVRPSLVVAREVYGGTALIRGLAGLPWMLPLIGGEQRFRPVAIDDLAQLIVAQASPGASVRKTVEVAGPETISLADMVLAYRAWLGFGHARIVRVSRWIAMPLLKLGDLAGWLGWASALRTTSLRQLDFDVSGRALPTVGVRSFSAVLAAEPAGVQDRWHARLYFLRPLSIVILGLYWLFSGLIALGPGHQGAVDMLQRAGLGGWALSAAVWTAILDVVLGLAVFVRRFSRWAVVAMAALAAAYLAVATVLLGDLWLDPLGPWLKIPPIILLCLFVAATDDRR
jgi:uncharacterized protein YbjT (DUF2867 family)